VVALDQTVRAARSLADALSAAMAQRPGRRPFVVGGDCSMLLGIVPALRRAVGAVGLCFLDGHPDFLDGRSSPTGETADMDLAVLAGRGADQLVTLGGAPPLIAPCDVVLIGHRTEHLDAAAAAELAAVPDEIERIDATALIADPSAVGQHAAENLATQGHPVWLHLDLDVLDPAALDAVTYPQPGGPNWDELTAVLEPLMEAPALLGMSVADFRPDLDPTGTAAARIVSLLEAALRRSGSAG
jgi:arginase